MIAAATPSATTVLLSPAEDAACLQVGPGRWLVGQGPFRRAAEVSPEQTAFYVNDFDLSDPEPWRLPAEAWETDELPAALAPEPMPEVLAWQPPDRARFEQVFQEVLAGLRTRRWEKAVPSVPEIAAFAPSDAPVLLHHLVSRLLAHDGAVTNQPYLFREQGRGFAGLTPETLFTLHGDRLHTMALAGTARPAEREAFEHDAKQLREHEMVVDMLRARLASWGEVTTRPREVLDLGGLIHFLTRFEVTLVHPRPAAELIRGVHPTPALGILPRTAENLATLHGWRARLDVPATFAAPFGAQWRGGLHVVAAIRGLWWDTERLWLPAGCGLVEGSAFDREWRELGLKRRWVKQAFGIES